MSSDEQDAALVRLVKDRYQGKQQRALMENEIRAASSALRDISTLLGMINPAYGDSQIDEQMRKAEPWLAPKLVNLVRDYLSTCEKLKEMDARARTLGID
jgi:hypothetical protein